MTKSGSALYIWNGKIPTLLDSMHQVCILCIYYVFLLCIVYSYYVLFFFLFLYFETHGLGGHFKFYVILSFMLNNPFVKHFVTYVCEKSYTNTFYLVIYLLTCCRMV